MAKLSKEKYLVLMVDDSRMIAFLIKIAMGKAESPEFYRMPGGREELVAYFQEMEITGPGQFPLTDLLCWI